MSTKQKLTKEQKALQRELQGVVLYLKNLKGETVRALAHDYCLSVGSVSARIKEGKGYVAKHPEITLHEAMELLNQIYVGATEPPRIKKTTPQQIAINMVYEKAIASEGIKSKEEYAIYARVFGYSADGSCAITSQQKSYIRRRVREIAKANSVKAVFVPDWFNVKAPHRSLKTMTAMAHNLYERIEEMVNDYMHDNNLPPTARYSVKQALARMVVEGVSPQSIERQCSGYSEVVSALTDNGVTTEENTVEDYAKVWNEGKHCVFSLPDGKLDFQYNLSAKDIHRQFEDLKDLDEAGYIY